MELMGLKAAREALTGAQLALIEDEADIPIIAEIEMMSPQKLDSYDRFFIKSEWCKDYHDRQREWTNKQNWFLGERLGRKPNEEDSREELLRTNNAIRYRAFYVIKFQDRVIDMSKRIAS